MIKPISFENVDNRYNLKNVKKDADANSFQGENLSLSNSQVARAILNRNNISFRNLLEPIEVTDKYNKPIAGKDHLDLPNIHVYEFPDTNLQVFVNLSNNISYPQFFTIIENNNYSEQNMIKEKLMQMVLKDKIPNLVSDNFTLSFASIDDIDLSQIPKFNKSITDLKLEGNELEDAKKRLIEEIKNNKKQNEHVNIFYELQDLKTEDEILQEINNSSVRDLINYHKKYIKNSCIKMFLTIPQKAFEANKNEILNKLNADLNFKFLNEQETAMSNIPIIEAQNMFMDDNLQKAYIAIPCANTKDSLLEDFVMELLNTKDDFPYSLSKENISYPLELKNNSDLKHNMEVFSISPKDSSKNFNKKEYLESLKEFCHNDLTKSLEKSKCDQKEYFKNLFINDSLDIIKNFELVKYQTDIFNIYETIDSISEKDIKEYINTYLMIKY